IRAGDRDGEACRPRPADAGHIRRATMGKWMRRAGAVVAGLLLPFAASAQGAWPTKPVRIIVPYAAGGVADLLPRIVGEKLAQKWGQPVVIENKAGASG